MLLLGKPGCHLCDDARAIITEVLADHPGVEFEEKSILDDPALLDAYAEEIPVVLIDGRVHTIWRVDPARLRAYEIDVSASASTKVHAVALYRSQTRLFFEAGTTIETQLANRTGALVERTWRIAS